MTLTESDHPVIWYQITEDDSDLFVFLLYLLHATQVTLPEMNTSALSLLESWESGQGPLPSKEIVHQYLNALSDAIKEPTLLVLDDIHLIINVADIAHTLDHIVALAPPDLHILLSSRHPVKLPNLFRWRAQGEVLTIDQRALAFTPQEIADLFADHYEYELTADEIQELANTTEGWAIALQMIWQSLRSDAALSVSDALDREASTMESLFSVITHEVLDQQPVDIQKFLKISATLRSMTPEACDALRQADDSAAMLAYLKRQDLFIVDLGHGALRYHHLFHQLLQQQAPVALRRGWHTRAAEYYFQKGDQDTTIYHALQAEDFERAARLLVDYGDGLLATGRLDRLGKTLDSLPPEKLLAYPVLLKYMGDLARLRSRFQEALGWYRQAETVWRERGYSEGASRALRGQARVYLDTVNPSKASELLQEALRLSDGIIDREANARLCELLAENKLNAGKPEEAEQFRQKAEALRREGPSESQLLYRVLLRTGQLKEARAKLENRADQERDEPVQTPRAHRETQLLLSLIYAFQGKADLSYQTALDGTSRGVELTSPFVTAVGYMRQGHALMLFPGQKRYSQAREAYEKAVDISRTISIPRLRVEAFWGLCRVYGYQGDLDRAAQLAGEAVEIAHQAGDEWIASLTRLTLGASYLLADRVESAHRWLLKARRGFQECSDPFGVTATQLWQCLAWFHEDAAERLAEELPNVLASCRQHHYGYLFTRPTLLGVPDERICVPLLILARDRDWGRTYAERLLSDIGLHDIRFHPGYQLKVKTLGNFQAWRGLEEIPDNGWRRSKSRQLFQFLVTFRHTPVDREQIYEQLWPDAKPGKAENNFKVTLSTLYHVLEPDRSPGSESAYIARRGSMYALRPEADLWMDVKAFTNKIRQAEKILVKEPSLAIPILEEAVQLYQGEYLPVARYETWVASERERLAVVFLHTADDLCQLYLERGCSEEAIEICQRILQMDNCWERAYRHLMQAYDMVGDHGQIARTYQRCVQLLEEELNITPSAETRTLYQKLIKVPS